MKRILTYTGLGVLIVTAGLYTWIKVSAVTPAKADGFHLKCTAPECGWCFTIPRDQVRTYPRDPNGQGFRCEKCGKFSAQIASRCEQCGEWYAVSQGTGREGGCPKCAGPQAAK
ncbi:MAG: hypothetical protein ACUVXJ_13535 [Phycisphaerae bacterium]